MTFRAARFIAFLAFTAAIFLPLSLRGEAMLQYFNTDWNEIAAKMPELAEAGYDSLWLPPPTKGSGGLSVGYDLFDRFDLGGKDQRGTVRTRYGTEAELIRLVEIAHRFGIRIYFDNVMNHNAFDVPGYNADTPIDIYPGFVPEDFHLRLTEDGSYRKWDNTRNWGDAWQVQHLGLADLIDIAQEPGLTNENFGGSEGGQFPKIKFVRQPTHPEFYCYKPDGTYVGFGPNNGITAAMLTDPANAGRYAEQVEDFLNRAARWEMDRTHADGLRLDAVKHVRADFFGATAAGADTNDYGYTGQVQRQFNLTRGFSDTNHRDTVFDTEKPRDDAMLFGEHLGEPPNYGDYLAVGMRLVDNPLRQQLNDKLGNPSNGLNGFDQAGAGGFSPETGVMHAQSHDNDYASRPELQQAFYYTRAGIGLLYTDGNNQAETLGESGGAFPRHANTNFLGQYNDPRIPNLLYIHNQFARGYQIGKWSDADFIAYERIDKRENPSMLDADGVTMLMMLNDNYANGQARSFATSFPATSFGSNAYLYNYSSYGGGFYKYASELSTVVVPPGGYFVFSWKNPDPSDLWSLGGGAPITILQNGQPAGTMSYERKDGRDGDKAFNPYNLPDVDKTDLKYTMTVPRLTSGSNLSFLAFADGSAENVLMELDGGIDLNGTVPAGIIDPGKRDYPPGINRNADTDSTASSTDVFLGYEQMTFDHRQYGEKFGAVNTVHCTIGSAGADTYSTTVGNGSGAVAVTSTASNTTNNFGTDGGTVASFVYHEPNIDVAPPLFGTDPKSPLPAKQYADSGNSIAIWGKTNSVGAGFRMFIYYTTAPAGTPLAQIPNPEGAGGFGVGTTKTAVMQYSHNGSDGNNWWFGAISPKPSGVIKYKLGIFKDSVGNAPNMFPVSSLFPTGATEVAAKKKMLTAFKVTGFNATTATYYPHNDYGPMWTGLTEGFHVLRARAFLKRDGAAAGNHRRASIYNTFTQTFYYDTQTPSGEISFPANNGDTVGGQSYGVVVRADPSVTEVWYHIDDGDASNDDVATKVSNGNGIGYEPFTDSNNNGVYDAGEPFVDLNGNGLWDNNVAAWVKVSELTPNAAVISTYPREWRFDYRNIPASGNATIKVRLRELSSSPQFSTAANVELDDTTGHFTTLIRTAPTAGEAQRMFIAYPGTDGQRVGSGYVMKVRFSDVIGQNVDDATLKSRFVVQIASSESGSLANPVTQGTSSYQIIRGSDPGYDDLAFTLPNLYNGSPDFIHTIKVTLTRLANSPLIATRQVKAVPTAQGSFVNITNPPEFDSDGKRYEIVLPDVPNPTPEQRQAPISVETSSDIQSVSIAFANNAGTASLATSLVTALRTPVSVTNGSVTVTGSETQITGTVSKTVGSSNITGNGTAFTNDLLTGDVIRIGTENFTISAIASPTTLTATAPATVTASSASAFLEPQFDQSLSNGNTIKIAGVSYTVSQIVSPSSLTLNSTYSGTTATGLTAYRVDGNPVTKGTKKIWTFLWTGMTQGHFTFTATAHPATGSDVTATRDATVLFRQIVPSSATDADDDDDGLTDVNETTITALPTSNPETWTNAQVQAYYANGHTDPLNPDTDGDGLPDALELGLRTATNPPTDSNADTNGDGFKNFIGDLDPPFYNTLGIDYPGQSPNSNYGRVPNVNSSSEGGDRAKQVAGSTTDPNNPDTDGDGILDGVEDANHNGWVDGDGDPLPTNFLPYLARNWPNGKMDPNENWTETDPNNPDTDGDGLSDGYGEDKNFDGHIEGDTNNNRIYDVGERWTETDPLNKDTDGDGLPDGWEVNHGLDPLDNGTTNLRTGGPGNPDNGANGDPDQDGVSNLTELINGTDPNSPNTTVPPPPGSIVIGPQSPTTIGAVTNAKEFTDWTADDLIVLDEYDGAGTNNQGSDVYHAYDGFDSSRDLVAFYAHDGGDVIPPVTNPPTPAGDGNFYFRVDLQDLKAYAETGNLDIYVAIDTGSPDVGEYALPDDIDTGTEMRWEAVVACYSSNNGRVYIDTNHALNSIAIGQNLGAFGVIARDQNTADGFKKAYYNSDLDSVEFSISRKALKDAGWNGDPSVLNFQVFTTRDGTNNTPTPGAGDIGGRSDIRDSIYDDFIASDYYKDQSNISGVKSVLRSWFSMRPNQPVGQSSNDRGKRVKVVSLIHGNQAIQPGTVTQTLINNGQGAGFYRVLDAHEAFNVPLSLHITPTLASAIQWAKVKSGGQSYHDGPAFNTRLENLIGAGTIDLLGTTFSDHILRYFHTPFNSDNVSLANGFLSSIYNQAPSPAVFWTPERVSDSGVLQKVTDLGYGYTFVDQMRHIFKWFGRSSALGNDGYRVNQINNTKAFAINDGISNYLFQNFDNGLPTLLRQLLNRKARDGQQDQVVVFANQWEDFGVKANADAYDKNLRWLASHPWIQIVTPDQIASGQVPYTSNGSYTSAWGAVARGASLSLPTVAKDFLDHATEENYDNWYNGLAGLEESLRDKVFNIRTGAPLPSIYGSLGINGVLNATWLSLNSIAQGPANTGLLSLAHATMHASEFETAFHDQTSNDLTKFSTGAYISPDSSNQTLAGFSKIAQAQTRGAAIYARVNAWSIAANSGTYLHSVVAASEDVDLDGEPEYLLFNDRVFALFERIGGRMTEAWLRDLDTGYLSQVLGNPVSYSGSETEEEGGGNFVGIAVNSYRTSGFKDWFAKTNANGAGTFSYVNDFYSVVPAPSGIGWKFTSSDGKISKTITLAPLKSQLQASYLTTGFVQLYVRFGLSPDLLDLLQSGQSHLSNLISNSQEVNLFNNNPARTVRACLRFGGTGYSGATFNSAATDIDTGVPADTVNMRNQAQTQQMELQGNGAMNFALGFETGKALTYDTDGDGLPDWFETQYGLNPNDPNGVNGANGDQDGDGKTNYQEYVLGSNPTVADSASFGLAIARTSSSTVDLKFPSRTNRLYQLYYSSNINGPWAQAGSDIYGDGALNTYTDAGPPGTASPPTLAQPRFYKLQISLIP